MQVRDEISALVVFLKKLNVVVKNRKNSVNVNFESQFEDITAFIDASISAVETLLANNSDEFLTSFKNAVVGLKDVAIEFVNVSLGEMLSYDDDKGFHFQGVIDLHQDIRAKAYEKLKVIYTKEQSSEQRHVRVNHLRYFRLYERNVEDEKDFKPCSAPNKAVKGILKAPKPLQKPTFAEQYPYGLCFEEERTRREAIMKDALALVNKLEGEYEVFNLQKAERLSLTEPMPDDWVKAFYELKIKLKNASELYNAERKAYVSFTAKYVNLAEPYMNKTAAATTHGLTLSTQPAQASTVNSSTVVKSCSAPASHKM